MSLPGLLHVCLFPIYFLHHYPPTIEAISLVKKKGERCLTLWILLPKCSNNNSIIWITFNSIFARFSCSCWVQSESLSVSWVPLLRRCVFWFIISNVSVSLCTSGYVWIPIYKWVWKLSSKEGGTSSTRRSFTAEVNIQFCRYGHEQIEQHQQRAQRQVAVIR